jgi:hypothetical protein
MLRHLWVRCVLAFIVASALTAGASFTLRSAYSLPVRWSAPVPIDSLQPAVRVDPPTTTTSTTTTTTTTVPPLPQLPTWTGPRPAYYGGNTGCSQGNANLIARAMWNVGASDWAVEQMLYIVSRESGCDSSAYNGNRRTGDDSWGFCQLNVLAGFFRSGQILAAYNPYSFAYNPWHNAQACAAYLFSCPWCISVWVGWPFLVGPVWFPDNRLLLTINAALAASLVAGIGQVVEDRLDR